MEAFSLTVVLSMETFVWWSQSRLSPFKSISIFHSGSLANIGSCPQETYSVASLQNSRFLFNNTEYKQVV